jgi:hypothetical protein
VGIESYQAETTPRGDQPMRRERPAAAAVLAAILALSACLEPPVSESLQVRLPSSGGYLVTVTVALHERDDYRDRPDVQDRLDAAARELDERRDPWADRIREMEVDAVREIVDRRTDDRITRVVRHVRGFDPSSLSRMLRDAGVDVAYAERDEWRELTLAPLGGGPASASQRQRVSASLATWSQDIAAYAKATIRLYRYLDAHPDHAKACLSRVLDDKTDDSALSPEEEELASAVADAMNQVALALWPGEHDAYTLDELSRRVYDCFPAPTTIVVSGTILEREGFPGELSAPLLIPERSLWSALARLEGRWFSPDPLVQAWRADVSGKLLDSSKFAALPRRVAPPPTAADVKRAIEAELRPPPVYRVRWKPAPSGDEDDPTRN